MAFRIKRDESLPQAIRRLARAQLRDGIRALTDEQHVLAERVHEVRTSIKKVRALTKLVRPVAKRPARRAERRLRAVAETLSPMRDAVVLLETYDALLDALPPAERRSAALFRRVRDRLAAGLDDAARPFESPRWVAKLESRLRRERRRTKRWGPPRDGHDRRTLGRGIKRGYRSARRAFERAYDRRTSPAFHRWRKAVKVHRHQLQLLERAWPEQISARSAELDRLGELLGNEHDLALLEEAVPAARGGPSQRQDRAELLGLIALRRDALRAEARPLGERLFAERPRAFGRRIRDRLAARPHRPARAPKARQPQLKVI
jgi:CHAD domain-containing protein